MSAEARSTEPSEPTDARRRTFIAVALPPPVRESLFAAAAALAEHLPRISWSKKVENLHVTLKFLGKVDDAQLDALAAALADRLVLLPPVAVAIRGFGAFPSPRRASVLWAGVEDAGQGLARIAAVVDTCAAGVGTAKNEPRPFRAHVTVGRTRIAVDARAALTRMPNRDFGSFQVSEVHIYESRLGRDGSTYLLRARLPLAPA